MPLPLYREKQVLLVAAALGALCVVLSAGCTEVAHHQGEERPNPYLTSDTRYPIPLSSSDVKEHRAVMLQHLETIQVIVNALVEEDYELAKGLTESHLGFFMHRQAMAYQQPGEFSSRLSRLGHGASRGGGGARAHHSHKGYETDLAAVQ